ncbi:hypothetical protein GF325_18415 [Candidatus Bathyarchaeota archaeon]|nr:hypothetical protein [Candidatus Bathyarchaeota archaeon]
MTPKKKSKPVQKVTYINIRIQKVKQKHIVEQKEKADKDGVIEVRTHIKNESWTTEEVKYKWKTTEYRIPLMKLGFRKDANKGDILEVLNNPQQIVNKRIQELLKKLVNFYGGIKGGGRGKFEFKTARFKKKKNYGPKKKVIMG